MSIITRRARFYYLSFLKYDFKASLTVFFVALPLCLGISLASGAPVSSGIISGIIGGIVVSAISGSELSVSGPAAGLTAICAAAITELGSLEVFCLAVAMAGGLQILLGVFRLGGFTHFIPSAVIKGMLAAIGLILISKQIPLLIGYDRPDFWTKELFNIISFTHGFQNIENLYRSISLGAVLIAMLSLMTLVLWKKTMADRVSFIPASFVTVLAGVILAYLFKSYIPSLALEPSQYVSINDGLIDKITLPQFSADRMVLKNALVICFVATLETLLSIEAIDKLDPHKRVSPQNRELVAQGAGNLVSGLAGGLPITAVIVRSSANAEAGARTRFSAFAHGIWLLAAVLFASRAVNMIPYCVLAVILIRTGYNLAKPRMIYSVYKLGREQFLPFAVTVLAILTTDLLVGVIIGILYAVYFLMKHTYRAGYTIRERREGHSRHYTIELALNVSFLNKKRIMDLLEGIEEYSTVEIIGSRSVYIDYDILEVLNGFRIKARDRHISLKMMDIPEVEVVEGH